MVLLNHFQPHAFMVQKPKIVNVNETFLFFFGVSLLSLLSLLSLSQHVFSRHWLTYGRDVSHHRGGKLFLFLFLFLLLFWIGENLLPFMADDGDGGE